jgi:hypothetical protein
MSWDVLFTDEYQAWLGSLDAEAVIDIYASIEVLKQDGPQTPRPHVDTLKGSRHANMKELRTQSKGRPMRSLFAFDPLRRAVVLVGGDKTGDKRFYEKMIPLADGVYDRHLEEIKKKKGG